MDDQPLEETRRAGIPPDVLWDTLDHATTEFSYLAGKTHRVLRSGFDLWIAHDAGLIHTTIRRTGNEANVVKVTTDIILWHDVRDVEVSCESYHYPGSFPTEEWSILIQYPRLSMKQHGFVFRDFCVAVARLAAEHH